MICYHLFCFFFFFNDTATTEIYTLSLHDALPISRDRDGSGDGGGARHVGRGRGGPTRARGARRPRVGRGGRPARRVVVGAARGRTARHAPAHGRPAGRPVGPLAPRRPFRTPQPRPPGP